MPGDWFGLLGSYRNAFCPNKFTNHNIRSYTERYSVKDTANNGYQENVDNKLNQHNSSPQMFDNAPNLKIPRLSRQNTNFFSYKFLTINFYSFHACIYTHINPLVQRSSTDCGASLCVIKTCRGCGGHSPRWAAESDKKKNKSRKMRWAGHKACMEDRRNAYVFWLRDMRLRITWKT
jgi:hypothetical protein